MAEPFCIYVGWDRGEPEAYHVAEFSLKRRTSIPLAVMPIKLEKLRAAASSGARSATRCCASGAREQQ
jgi:hypothetical protein